MQLSSFREGPTLSSSRGLRWRAVVWRGAAGRGTCAGRGNSAGHESDGVFSVRGWLRHLGIAQVGWLLFAVTVAGCQTGQSTGAVGRQFALTAPRTPFYIQGPAQASGPDATLTAGQIVTLLGSEYGYSRVRLENGSTGYIVSDSLASTPVPTPPPVTPDPGARTLARNSKRTSGGGNPAPRASADPLFDVSDLPLPPLPEEPEKPASRPRFRF